MNGSRLIKRPVRLNGSLCRRIDRGGSCSERSFRSLLFARNGMGATSDQCQCESDQDPTLFEIENHEYLPTTAQAIAAPYRFPPTHFSYRRACSVAHWSSRVVADEPVHVKSYSRNVAEGACQFISDLAVRRLSRNGNLGG